MTSAILLSLEKKRKTATNYQESENEMSAFSIHWYHKPFFFFLVMK